MKKAVIFTLLGFLLLSGVSLVVGQRVFAPWQRLLAEPQPGAPGAPVLAPGEMSWKSYKKVRLALGSFDLVNGLTKKELETISADRSLGFYYLLACLWLVLGLRLGLRRPLRRWRQPRPGVPHG